MIKSGARSTIISSMPTIRVVGRALMAAIGEDIDAAGDLDKLGNHPIPEISGAADNPMRASAGADVMSPRGRPQMGLDIAFFVSAEEGSYKRALPAGPAAGARHSRRSRRCNPARAQVDTLEAT